MAAKMIAGAAAFDEAKYPNWSGEWRRPRFQWTSLDFHGKDSP